LAGEDDAEGGKSAKGRARQTISDKRNVNILGNSAAAKKKKSTMNVRTALLYRKNLATLVEESVRNLS
jgi:zinc finger HIT domain-containing protein 1